MCNCICPVQIKKCISNIYAEDLEPFYLKKRLLKNMMKPSDVYSYAIDMYLVYSECIMKRIPSSKFLGNN